MILIFAKLGECFPGQLLLLIVKVWADLLVSIDKRWELLLDLVREAGWSYINNIIDKIKMINRINGIPPKSKNIKTESNVWRNVWWLPALFVYLTKGYYFIAAPAVLI